MWESFAPTLLTVFISAAITFPLKGLMVGFGWVMLATTIMSGGQPRVGLIIVIVVGGYGSILFCSMIVRILLAFTYPLIAERGLQPLDAIKWSFRGASKHIPGLFALSFLNGLIVTIGMMFCLIPGLMYVPVAIASMAFAHVKIYGLADEPSYRHFEEGADAIRTGPPRGAKRSQWQSLDSLDPKSPAGQAILAPPATAVPEPPAEAPAAVEPAPEPEPVAEEEPLAPVTPELQAADTVPPAAAPPLPEQDTVPPASESEDSIASMRDAADAEVDKTVFPTGGPAPKAAPIDPEPLEEAASVEIDKVVEARFPKPTPEFGVAETRLMDANPFAADAKPADEDETTD